MIPTSITICGVPHQIKLSEDAFNIDAHFGLINYTKAEITINRDMPEAMQKQAICHEWLHGALVMIGENDLTNNERFVSALSMAINLSFDFKEDRTE